MDHLFGSGIGRLIALGLDADEQSLDLDFFFLLIM